MLGIVAQVTIVIQKNLTFLSQNTFLLILIPLTFILQLIHAPAITQKLFYSLTLNTALGWCEASDTGITLLNSVTIYFFTSAWLGDSEIAGSAQYIFALKITEILSVGTFIELATVFVIYYTIHHMHSHERIKDTMSLVMVSMTQDWIMQYIPKHAKLQCILVLLYVIYPFMQRYQVAIDAYNFLVITATSSFYIEGFPYWIQAVLFMLVWHMHKDVVSETISATLVIRLVQLAIIHFVHGNMGRSDPILVYTVIIVFLQIVNDFLS